MKKTTFFLIAICIMLTSCSRQEDIPTVFPTVPPQPSLTATFPITSTPTKIIPTQPLSTPTSTAPTLTPFPPYQNKNVIFEYSIIGNLADFMEFFDPPSGNVIAKIILYDDGQILIHGSAESYDQKVLSPAEIKSFLSQLETFGFFSLESNQKDDQTDKLYDFGNTYHKVADGLWDCIFIQAEQSRDLCVREAYLPFVIPEMKSILNYLDEYRPVGMTPYGPDRILLSIEQNIDTSIENPPAIPWDDHFPSLEYDASRYTTDTSDQIIFIDGDMAKKISLFFENKDGSKVVSQNGKEYYVNLRILLPHEKVKNPQQ